MMKLTPHEIIALGLYYYFKKNGKERKDIEEKALKIKRRYNWTDDEFESMCEKCYMEVMSS